MKNTKSLIVIGTVAVIGMMAISRPALEYVKSLNKARKDYIIAQNKLKRDIEQTRKQLESIKVKLNHKEYKPENDAWGTGIVVKEDNEGAMQGYTIISAGADKIFETNDDIISVDGHVSWRGTGKIIGEAGTDISKGIWDGIKAKFWD